MSIWEREDAKLAMKSGFHESLHRSPFPTDTCRGWPAALRRDGNSYPIKPFDDRNPPAAAPARMIPPRFDSDELYWRI